jgi:Oligoendopeptidase F
MGSLSYIRFSLNTNDEFYTKEKEFFDKFGPELQLILQELELAVLNSPYIDELKKVYPPVVFKNLELSVKSMNEEMVPMLVEESNLVTKYSQLINNVEIDFMGEKYNPATISKFFSNNDREIRKSAMFAFGNAMNNIKTELDSYYDELVKIRTKMGQTLNMETYTQLGYYRMNRNCYDKEDVAKFRANVKKYIVPLVSEIKKGLKEEFKWDKLMVYDNSVITKDEPKPIGTPEEIFANGSKMYNEMDSYVGSVFDRMVKDEAFDYMPRKGKWGGGYCTELADYKTPFILANFNGSSHDVEVLTHEFGHALAAENAFSLGFMQRQPTMESCEVHSMSMEFLTYPWMKLFFGDNVDNFEFYHMVSSLCFLPYGTIVDYFQQQVYDNPNMTAKGKK